MLTEFAFTPSIFDQEAHKDEEAWRDQLRHLASAMFPSNAGWPVVIADLYAGSWSSHIVPYIERITDHRARKCCQELLTHISNMLVVRPECGDWPFDDDVAWCREAIASSVAEPIDRIISVRPTKNSRPDEFSVVRCIDEVEDRGFWRGIRSDASPRMIIGEQVNLLRKLCLHSQWVAYINPYGFSSEQDFTLQLLDVALGRPSQFGRVDVELHGQAPDVSDPQERALRQTNVTNNMIRRIGPGLPGLGRVELYFWLRLRERILLAGGYVNQSSGIRRKRPRWGVSMNHVAHCSDGDDAETEWKLLSRERITAWFGQFVAETAPNKPLSMPIIPSALARPHDPMPLT